MTKYKYIVQVHPVENGEPNLAKVVEEWEFDNKPDADWWFEIYKLNPRQDRHGGPTKAVYLGRVNDITGELE